MSLRPQDPDALLNYYHTKQQVRPHIPIMCTPPPLCAHTHPIMCTPLVLGAHTIMVAYSCTVSTYQTPCHHTAPPRTVVCAHHHVCARHVCAIVRATHHRARALIMCVHTICIVSPFRFGPVGELPCAATLPASRSRLNLVASHSPLHLTVSHSRLHLERVRPLAALHGGARLPLNCFHPLVRLPPAVGVEGGKDAPIRERRGWRVERVRP